MKVTINGVTYEGTENEIRRIVENPPNYGGDRINYPYPINPGPYVTPTCPEWPPLAPSYPTNIEVTWGKDFPRNWDGSPRVTCCAF